MPVIPGASQQATLQAQPNVKSSVNMDPNAFGANVAKAQAGLGQGFGQIGDLMEKRRQEMQTESDKSKVLETAATYEAAIRNYMYNPDTGIMKRTGNSAVDMHKQAATDLEKLAKDFDGKLENDTQRRMFRAISLDRFNGNMNEITHHEVKERRAAKEMSANSFAANTVESMIAAKTGDAFVSGQDALMTTMVETYGSYGNDVVKQKYNEFNGRAHLGRYEILKNQDPFLAKDYLERNKDDIPAGLYAKMEADAISKTKDVEIKLKSQELLKKYGSPEAALEAAKNGKGKVSLVFSEADAPDWTGVTTKAKSGTSEIWNDLVSAGLSPEITSGKRSGDGRSHHDNGNGVDIYLGDSSGRLAENDPKLQAIMEKAKANGWQEVLYHDAGSGLHLHLGDYKGSYTEPKQPTAAELLDLKKQLDIDYAHQRQVQNIAEHDEQIRVKNSLAGVVDLNQRAEIIKSSNMQPYQKDEMIKALVENRKSDRSVTYQLEVAAINGTLSIGNIQRAAPFLNADDIQKYSIKLAEIGAKRVDTDGKAARSKLKQDIEAAFPGSSDKDTRESLVNDVMNMLDREGVKGWQQYSRGTEFLKETGVVVDNKGKSGAAKKVIQYGQANAAQYGQLERDFGADLVRLTIKGFVAEGINNPDAMEVNRFLSSIGAQAGQGNANAQSALDWLLRNDKPIGPKSYSRVYEEFANAN